MEVDGGGCVDAAPESAPPVARPPVTFKEAAQAYIRRGLFPVPAKGGGARGKQPKFCHKYNPKNPDLWTRARAQAYGLWHQCEAMGLLLDARRSDQGPGEMRGLLVLDFDTHALYSVFLSKFPELDTCPLARTRHGYHAYFTRSPLCDAMSLTDGARQFQEVNGQKLELDIKSYTKSGAGGHSTAGFISVPPSEGKAWVRDICTVDAPEISDDLVGYLCERKVGVATSKKRRAETTASTCTRATKASLLGLASFSDPSCDQPETIMDVSPPVSAFAAAALDEASRAVPKKVEPVAWWQVDPERAWRMTMPCLRAAGFKSLENMSTIAKPNERSSEFGYKFGFQFFDPVGVSSGPCPLCGKPDNHTNNSFRVLFRASKHGAGFDRMVKNYSENCVPLGQRTRPLPFSAEGARAWSDAFLPACDSMADAAFRVAARALGFTPSPASVAGWSPRAAWARDGRLVFLPLDRDAPARVVDLRASTGRLRVAETRTPWDAFGEAPAPAPSPPWCVRQTPELLSVLAAEPKLRRSAPT